MQSTVTHAKNDSTLSSTRDAIVASFRGSPHRVLAVGAHKLAYRKFGHGPDLVFVHGWPLHSGTFRTLVPLLAVRFTCHLIDLPGSGQSESAPGAPLDFPSQAETLHAAVDVLGPARYGLLAHDSGGFTARMLAARDARVVALVSGDTEIPGHTPDIIKTLLAAVHTPGGSEIVRLAMHARAMRRSSRGYAGCFADLDYIDGEFHELMVAPILRSRAAWARQAEILRTIDDRIHDQIRDAHTRITAPVLFVWGDADPIFPIEKARAMLGQLKGGARLEAIPGGKAFVHEERPGEFAAWAMPFLLDAFARVGSDARYTVA
jgi:pimeloyl-ACP methyl ester carboxylesterase